MNKFRFILTCFVVVFVAGCANVETAKDETVGFVTNEADKKFDIVLGDDYVPPVVQLTTHRPPQRVLFLPICSHMADSYAEGFLSQFKTQFEGFVLVTPTDLREDQLLEKRPTQAEVIDFARQANCSTIFFMELKHPSPYPPLRVTVDITVQALDGTPVYWKGLADYDSADQRVANAARRFLKTKLKHSPSPERSKAILNNNRLYLQFTAWDLANHLNTLAEPPPPSPSSIK